MLADEDSAKDGFAAALRALDEIRRQIAAGARTFHGDLPEVQGTRLIDREAFLAGMSGPGVEDTFDVTFALFKEMYELGEALEEVAETTKDPDLAARQRDVADSFEYGCESFGGQAPLYRATFEGGHQVKVRVQRDDPADADKARAEAAEKARQKVLRQAARRRSLLGRALTRSSRPLPTDQEPLSVVRIG